MTRSAPLTNKQNLSSPPICQVSPKTETIKGIADTFEFEARGYSVNWLHLELATAPAAIASA